MTVVKNINHLILFVNLFLQIHSSFAQNVSRIYGLKKEKYIWRPANDNFFIPFFDSLMANM
jgi:dolichol kinase